MRLRPDVVLAAAALAVALGCVRFDVYPDPPAGSYSAKGYQVTVGGAAIPLQGADVTRDFFVGVTPVLGRFFAEPDFTSNQRVAVLSHKLWEERFGSAPDIIGRELDIDGRRTTVVGIAPRGYNLPDGALLWTAQTSGR